MTIETSRPTPQKPLRLWPGVLAVTLQWLVRFVVPLLVPGADGIGLIGGAVGGLVIVVWWLFFSRAPWVERVGALVLMVLAVIATSRFVHASISNGLMGMMLPITAIPVLSLVLVSWAVVGRRLSAGPRRAALVAGIALGCGVFTLLRTSGVSGDGGSEFHWRWTPTPEQLLLARAADEPAAPAPAPAAAAVTTPEPPLSPPAAAAAPPPPSAPAAATPSGDADAPAATAIAKPAAAATPEPAAIWPGFRGPNRDSVIHGASIETDWSKSPPLQMWRHPVGPGWSSFAVRGHLVYTQEQRGDDEDVSCYDLTTGKVVWRHRDAARFWESNGGAGPRGTPTLSNGRVYTFGATGIVNALDAGTGAVVWSRNAIADTGAKTPGWGFASSPLVLDDSVVVAASGRLVSYEVATGKIRWLGPARGSSYSSPHSMTIDGVAQILLLSSTGVTSVAPADGTQLWEHAWDGVPIVQPAQTADGDVLISSGDMAGGAGVRRIAVARGPAGWTVQERWTSRGLKPYFNDVVVHNGYAFGFDGSILSCINLQDGERKWKGGRYGHGQLVLLPEQDLLLVLSEEGELALVKATPDQFTEVARFPAIEGKTWNHPVLVGDVLLVRNGEEMAAFKLTAAGR